MRVKTMWSVTQSAMWDWWNDNCMRLSASLAFYTALSLAPLVIIVVGTAGLITERQLVADQLEQQIDLLMGSPSRLLVHTILATTEPQSGTLAAMVGIVTLVIGATAVFGELQAALNLIWEVKPKPVSNIWANLWSWLGQRFFSLAIVLAIAFLLLVSLAVSAALAGVAHYLQGPELTRTLLSCGLEVTISILVITCLFALLFRYVPDAEIQWRDVWLVAWQSSIDRLIRIDSPSRHEWWFEEKEIPHGQISCHPHGRGTIFTAENGLVGQGGRSKTAPWPHFAAGGCESGRHEVYRRSHC